MAIGINETGSLQPIKIADGNKTKKAIKIPLMMELIFKSIVAIKSPTTIHMENADRFASHVRFCIIIGITSIIPATVPNNNPILIFFISFNLVVYCVYLLFLSNSSIPIVCPNSLELLGAFAVTILSSIVTPDPVYFAPLFSIVFTSDPATVTFLPAKIPNYIKKDLFISTYQT